MKLVLSKLAAIAAASLALVCASACNGDKEPVQDVTFLTFGPAGAQSLALGYSEGRGVHVAHIDASSVLHMARSQAGEETGGGGSSFFSAGLAGASSFSGATGGASSFSGATGAVVGFSGSTGGAGSFSGTAIRNGAACDLSGICRLAAVICEEVEGGCDGFTEGACIASIDSAEFQSSITDLFGEDDDLAAVFCVFVNFISCIFEGASGLDDVSEEVAEQCAQAAGFAGLVSSESTGF